MDKGAGRATAAGFGAILLWSTTIALSRSLAERLGPLGTGAFIFTGSGALMLVFLFLKHRGRLAESLAGTDPRYRYGCWALFLLYTVSFYLAIGLAHSRAQTVELALLNYLWPSLTILFSVWLLPVRAAWTVAPGLALAFGGVMLVLIPPEGARPNLILAHVADNPAAYAAATTAGITWALYSVLIRRWAPAESNGMPFFMLTSGLALALLATAFPEARLPFTLRAAVEAVILILSTAAAYWLWDLAMRRGQVTKVAAASNFTPLLSTLVSCAYLTVIPGPRVWGGAVLIALGSLVCWKSVKETSRT